MFSIYRISGHSMLPNLGPDDYVFCLKPSIGIRVGTRVVAQHPNYGIIVKRVWKKDPRGYFWLSGENNQSIGSEKIGWVSPEHILGRVLFSICS